MGSECMCYVGEEILGLPAGARGASGSRACSAPLRGEWRLRAHTKRRGLWYVHGYTVVYKQTYLHGNMLGSSAVSLPYSVVSSTRSSRLLHKRSMRSVWRNFASLQPSLLSHHSSGSSSQRRSEEDITSPLASVWQRCLREFDCDEKDSNVDRKREERLRFEVRCDFLARDRCTLR